MKGALLPLLVLAGAALAAEEPYELRMNSSVEGERLVVAPRLEGPAGARLSYEMVSSKEGGAGKSNTSQSGTVALGGGGAATLATLRLGVAPGDTYVITVKVFDGARLVAEEALRYP